MLMKMPTCSIMEKMWKLNQSYLSIYTKTWEHIRETQNKNNYNILPPTWGVHEVKVHKVVNAKFLQLQYNGAKVTAEYLRVRLLLHLVNKSLLCVQSETFARLCAPSSTCPLLGTRLTNGWHKQRFDANAWIVHLNRRMSSHGYYIYLLAETCLHKTNIL